MYLEPRVLNHLLFNMREEILGDLTGSFQILEDRQPDFAALPEDQKLDLFRRAVREVIGSFPEPFVQKAASVR